MEVPVSGKAKLSMYKPPVYEQTDPDYIFRFIQQHPFATFVLQGERLLATHIPILTMGEAGNFTLFGHIANYNPQRQRLKDGLEVLLVFQGPHGYISSSWYKEPNISTWDYSAVHVNATLKLQTQLELRDSLRTLVNTFESEQEKPLYYDQIPPELIEEDITGITGFWLSPTHIDAIAKLSQNQPKENIKAIVSHLHQRHCPMQGALANQIQKENDRND